MGQAVDVWNRKSACSGIKISPKLEKTKAVHYDRGMEIESSGP